MSHVKQYYVVSDPMGNFADKNFINLIQAKKFVQEHRNGLPKEKMSKIDRGFWKSVGKNLRIFSVQEITDEVIF